MTDSGYVYDTYVVRRLRDQELSARKLLYYAKVGRIAAGNTLVVGFAMPDELETLRNRGHYVVGIDRDAFAVRAARAKGHAVVRADVDKGHLPFRDMRFDAVFALHVIEHVVHAEVFLDEIHRVLQPNGIVVIETPDFEFWGPARFFDDKTHTTPFTMSLLRQTLAGRFDLVRIRRMCPLFLLWRFTNLAFSFVNPLNMRRTSLTCVARRRPAGRSQARS